MNTNLLGWCIILGVSLFVLFYMAARQVMERGARGAGGGTGRRYAEGLEFFESISPFVAMLKPASMAMLGAMSSKDIREIEDKLADAGVATQISIDEFVGLRLVGALGGVGIGFLMLLASGMHPMAMLAMLLFAMIGWVYPIKWLASEAETRQMKIFRGLSDTLDVLAVSVAAGLEMRGALERVVQIGSEPILDREIQRTLQEIDKGGKGLEEGFEDLRDRVSLPEMTAFVNVVLMAIRLGASGMSEILMEQADAIRQERVLRAEKQANQMGSKILFPIAMFIFPAVIVTLLGPMALEAYLSFGVK